VLDHLFLKDIARRWVIIKVIGIRYSSEMIWLSNVRIIYKDPPFILWWNLAELGCNVFIKNLDFLSFIVLWVSVLGQKIFVFNWDIVTSIERWRHKWIALHHRLGSPNFFITEGTIINCPNLVSRWCFYFLSEDWFIIMLL
jgi:hypothetical protein